MHQRLDHEALFRGITKASARLAADSARHAVDRALAIAAADRPGPVHLDCPGDVLATAADDDAIAHARLAAPDDGAPLRLTDDLGRSAWSDSQRFAPLFARARKPMLLVGLGALGSVDARAIRQFCREQRVPALVTYKAKGVVPDDDPWFAGVVTNGEIERAIIDESDLLIALGLDTIELLPRPWTFGPPLVGFGRWLSTEQTVPFRFQAIANVMQALEAMRARLGPSDWSSLHVRRSVEAQQAQVSVPARGLSAQRVVSLAAARFAKTHRVTVDAGAHMFAATMLWPVAEPHGMLISNGLSTMGFALPAAIGSALGDRDRPVVAMIGDGGLLMCGGELLTLVRERLPVVVIVFNDASLSLIEIKQQQRQLPAAGVALGAVDWAAVASGFGLPSFVAADEGELGHALERAAAASGPSLIDARIDRSNYLATMRVLRGLK